MLAASFALDDHRLPLFWRLVLGIAPLRAIVAAFSSWLFPELRAWRSVRARVLDTWLADSLVGTPPPQRFVVLGAGLDQRAARFAAELEGLEVVVIDRAKTLRFTRSRLARSLGVLPRHVQLVAADGATAGAAQALRGPLVTCVLWEAKSMFLDLDDVDLVMRSVAALPTGSTILFDYLRASAAARPEAVAGGAALAYAGEPYRSSFDDDKLAAWLSARGLILEDRVLPMDADRRLRGPLSMHVLGPPCELFALARARVAPR